MIGETVSIETFNELNDAVQKLAAKNWQEFRSTTSNAAFRGEKSAQFQTRLTPKLGRIKKFKYKGMGKDKGKRILRYFKDRAIPFLDRIPQNRWEWLGIAQHHGLPTMLLDWTRNPLVAAYFAVEEAYKGDSVIYIYTRKYIDTNDLENPFELTTVEKFFLPHLTPRIKAQSGLFTIHPDPKESLEEAVIRQENSGILDRIIIKSKFRKPLKKLLSLYGFNRASLFPDLDGISKYIEWELTDVY